MASRAEETRGPRRRASASAWPIAAWMLVAVSAAVLAVGVAGEVLAVSLVLDLISFWPGLALAVLLASALRTWLRSGPARLAAILPLLLLTWMWGGLAVHFAEWDLLPSSSADVEGPSAEGTQMGELSVQLSGSLTVRAEGQLLYSVRPEREGGSVGVPEVIERLEGGQAAVLVHEVEPGPWFANGGWRLSLSPGVLWALELDAPRLQVDLVGVQLGALVLEGSGTARLPVVEDEVPVRVEGDLILEVPAGTGTVVTGPARVPEGWVANDDGWRSPEGDPGYLVTVEEGAELQIRER